ncbi:MAG: diaminopimelate decarboxylase [Candidatus Margulisbacteria bacterium]|nr:diaminopimelate decarboxylase [Candidatus Margulisiibacteriota bacterium]MBU1021570.1 diaminopimelate decarboxylase [Candidatus Margulisiibacteriota bacterium]MBU1728721.1 diaminopimelate decarboxylase [Candidatus Margulisiibacteriota bacterium]MBU1955172.1 diaminopimelate decarboxylase [Candidatus Margulisiibacteriota bacterium]
MSFPATAKITKEGIIEIGGVSVEVLAEKFGTPLYVMDEQTIRQKCREYRLAFQNKYPNTSFIYASKALSTLSILKIVAEEGFGLDISSGGELYTALKAGVDPETIYFHGNNKPADEITEALEAKIGRFVVDNLEELNELNMQALKRGEKANILVRLNPGVEAHTHEFIQTGKIDSKFGFPQSGIPELIKKIKAAKAINFVGIHAHIGSQIFEADSFAKETDVLIELGAKFKKEGLEVKEINIGGGIGISYVDSDDPPPIEAFAEKIAAVLIEKAEAAGLDTPKLVLEPGRSIVGEAGITIYRVGSVKHIPGIRTYVSVDGGMLDNPRPILYGAQYKVLVANRALDEEKHKQTIGGRFCESGDILFKDVHIPMVKKDDLLVVFCTGAYGYSMASNYNRVPRPAMVLVNDGKAKLIIKRETYQDLIKNDILI